MTKRITQTSTVAVPATVAHAQDGTAPVSAKAVPAATDEAAKAVVVVANVEDKDAPVSAETVMAVAAPAPLAMVDAAVAPLAAAAATAAAQDAATDDTASDATPYIIGGVLLAGGIAAIALSGGDDNSSTPAPTPTPTPTNTVTFSSAAAATIAENSAVTATVIDVNAAATQTGAITYTLGGTDAALFNIDAATGIVTFRSSPNFETRSTYSITVTAASAGTPAATATQTIAVTVTNVNEAPTFATATATATVAENAAATTTVFTAAATDPDATTTLTYSLTGTDAALLAISATGVVTLRAPADFETKSSYVFNVVATDNATPALSASQAVTLTVTNVNEAPTFAAATRTTTLAENVAAGAAIVTGGATDVDAATTLTYTLTGTDAALFAVNATTGAVTLIASPNFEAKPSYSFNLVATDAGGLAATQANTVTITNVNEAPAFATATATATAINENVAAGAVVFTAAATDPDAGSTLTYTLGGADAARFTIGATTGIVTLIASPDFETKPSYAFNVVATDAGGLAATQAVTLAINDLPEGVVLVGVQNLSAATGNVAYTESAGTANTSTLTNFTAGDTITVDVPTSSYSFSNNGADLLISFANGGIVNQITLVGAVNANAVIFNEFTAEQAVGSNFFLPGTSVPVPPAAANTIDGAGSSPTYNAANAAVTFTDNAGVANTTTISNFTTDDRFVVTGAAAGSYSFSNNGANLIISFANGGIVNQVTLTGAVNANAIVFNEASAEAALGADFFRYA